ncbi:hypothetical protein MOQ_007728 [Trypanosoma cruzi marinkellei]|uniref:Kinesin n=1 Tax=Trypanosoma cruzi marinkellei TaxID=85056 RepID=K2MN17_TRYCR|nr:hypothetical protein MOQ_007728 [Trypanosoma cruzi marinkellei]
MRTAMGSNGGGGGHVTVALNLSAGRCTAAENNQQRSAICVVHSDPTTGDPGGLAMRTPCVWAKSGDEEEEAEGGNSMLAVRTPFLTVEGGEAGALPYTAYTQELARHVVNVLMQSGGAELLTVNHGASGSGKSIQLFGPTVGDGVAGIETGQRIHGNGSGLFAAVLQQIFAAADLDPCVALSVVECRPSSDGDDDCHPRNGTMGHMNGDDDDDDDDERMMSMEAIDLLARATDTRSPTGCFMEDYADIPATRYVRCGSVTETLAALQTALSHSLAWQSVSTALSQGHADVFGMPDTRLNAERRRRAAEAMAAEERQRKEFSGASCTSGSADFLRPTAGASSHVLVTLLLRYGGGVTSIWRVWDLSGPTVWVDDGSPALRMAFNTHVALSLMAHRYMHRDQLQGGWWTATPLPEQIEEIIPLFSTPRPGRKGVDGVVAMIEAIMQHSCSAVVWIASLRFDARYDDINWEVLEAAASLLAGSDETNGKVIAELRRRRRQENLDAAARVLDMFAIPFSPPAWRLQGPTGRTLLNISTSSPNAFPQMTRTTTTTAASREVRLISPKREVEKGVVPMPEKNNNSIVSSAGAALMETSAGVHNSSVLPLPPPLGTATAAAADVRISPWASLVDKVSCLEAQRLHGGQRPQNELSEQRREGEGQGCSSQSALPLPSLSLLSPPVPSYVSSLADEAGVCTKSPCGASPLSPPSVAGTEHPVETVTTAHELKWKIFSWDTSADEDAVETSSIAGRASQEDGIDSEDVRQWGVGTVSVPSNGLTDLASTVRHLLEEPLAKLREISTQYEEEFNLHRRVIVQLRELLSSDAATLEELQRRVKALVTAEEEVAARALHGSRHAVDKQQRHSYFRCRRETTSVEKFGPSVSLQTTLDREVAGCDSSNGGSGRSNNKNNGESARPCGGERGGHRKCTAAVSTRELLASERKIRFLERQLLRLEGENMSLRAEMSSRRVGGGTVANVRSLEGVFNDILQRCSALYAKKVAEVNRIERRYNTVLDAFRRLQQQQQQEGERRTTMTPVAAKAVLQDAEVLRSEAEKPHFAVATNRCHAHRIDCSPQGCGTIFPPVDLVVSPAVENVGDISAIDHLRRLLLRATKFTTPSTGSPPPQDISNGVALSIDRGSNASCQLREKEETGDDIFTGLHAFREAAETARNSALRALFVAKQAVQKPESPLPTSQLLPYAAGTVDYFGGGDALVTDAHTLSFDAGAALEREEANVYRAVGSLQREAAELEHTAIEAISRERQLLSRVLLT